MPLRGPVPRGVHGTVGARQTQHPHRQQQQQQRQYGRAAVDEVGYRFERFQLLPQQRLLLREGQPVRLGGRAFDLLLTLVQRRQRVVPRNELFECVWPGRVVEDDNLKAQVMALRKLLGAAAIATVPGRGYRFVLAVDGFGAEAAAATSGRDPIPGAGTLQARDRQAGTAVAALPLIPLTPLIGRAAEVQALHQTLTAQRLVTVCGPGGIGKTLLARHVAATLRTKPADGVWFVDLTPLTEAAQLPGLLARTLGFAPSAERESALGLARACAPLAALIVLDNCEHVIAAAAQCAAALTAHAPGVRVLATSREPLRVQGEYLLRLPPLALPEKVAPIPPGAPVTAAVAADAPEAAALQLLVLRLQAARPGFRLDGRSRAAAIEICHCLDGIPLALELAAARAASLGLEAVRQRLPESLRLLGGGARDAPSRHDTLLEALRWSHALLNAAEQAVFRRLGVLAGPFDLALAEAVAADEGMDGLAVVEHLAALVDKSLLMLEPTADGAARYRLLHSSRAFALQELESAGETQATQRALALALLQRLRAADEAQLSTPGLVWIESMHADADHRRAALAWARGPHGDAALALALFAQAGAYWLHAGALAEGAALHRSLAGQLTAVDDPELQARYRLTVARLASSYAIDPAEGEAAAAAAAAGFAALCDARRRYVALYLASAMCERSGHAERVAELAQQMRALEQPQWPPVLRQLRRWADSRLLLLQGRMREHRDACRREVQLCQAAGDERTAWLAAHSLALAELNLGHAAAALQVLDELVERIEARGLQRRFPFQIAMRALALIACDDLARGLPATRIALTLLRTESAVWWLGEALGRLALLRGDARAAAQLQGWAQARTEERGDRRGLVIQREHERLAAALPAHLPAADLAALRAAGALLDDAQVVALALGEDGGAALHG